MSTPSLDTWINVEYPQLVAAFTAAWGHPPDHQWAAFQTYRRYMEPDVWPFAKMLAWEGSQNGHEPPAPAVPDVPPILPLTTDGPIFLSGGQPWRYKGVTAFKLCRLFADGQNIDGFLSDYAGFNVLRVFDYVPAKDWGAEAWESCTPEQWRAFLDYVNARGFYVEIVLLTDDDPARIAGARALVRDIGAHPGVLWEAGNEPETHKAINTAALRDVLPAPCSSGNYEDSRHWYGTYGTAHTGRDGEWPRRAHDLIDYYHGSGPNFPEEPACRVPWVADEPIRPDQAGFNAGDFAAYYGACSLLGAGATLHTETGKFGRRPTEEEKRIAAVVLDALNRFPADAPRGAYSRPDEQGATLRTYKVGPYIVRIRPTDGKVFP